MTGVLDKIHERLILITGHQKTVNVNNTENEVVQILQNICLR